MNMLNNNFNYTTKSIVICVITIVAIVCFTIMSCCETIYNNNSKEIDKLKAKIISIEEKLQK